MCEYMTRRQEAVIDVTVREGEGADKEKELCIFNYLQNNSTAQFKPHKDTHSVFIIYSWVLIYGLEILHMLHMNAIDEIPL